MTMSPHLDVTDLAAGLPEQLRSSLDVLESGYFRHTDAQEWEIPGRSSQVFAQHLALGAIRAPRTAVARVYRPGDDTGLGAAIQIVTDDMPLLVDSVTAALRRLGAGVIEVIHPIFQVSRDDTGRLTSARLHGGENGGGDPRESWMHVQLHPSVTPAVLDEIELAVPNVLTDVRRVVDDSGAILEVQRELASTLDGLAVQQATAYSETDLSDCAALLRWLSSGHYRVLGYARYDVNGKTTTRDATSALGVLRPSTGTEVAVPPVNDDQPLLTLSRGSSMSTVHRSVYPYFVGVAEFGADGAVIGQHLFVGIFAVTAVHENVLDIPVIARRVRGAIERAGFDLDSFSGQAMLEVIQSFPRMELFSADADSLFTTTTAVLNTRVRRQVRLFMREDRCGGFVSCLVYLPRDRYTTRVRLEMQDILVRELGGVSIDYTARISESELANVHFTVNLPGGAHPDTSEAQREHVQELLSQASRTWEDDLNDAVQAQPLADPVVTQRYADAFPESYKQDVEPNRALFDMLRLEHLEDGAIGVNLYRKPGAEPGHWRFGLFITGAGVSLSQVLPVLQSLGVEVVDERPYQLRLPDGRERWIYDFGLIAPAELLRRALNPDLEASLGDSSWPSKSTVRQLETQFTEAFEALWFGRADADQLNELVLLAGLPWREVTILRAYAKYLRQAGFPYSQDTIARVLLANPDAAQLFTQLFAALFDPDAASAEQAAALTEQLNAKIDSVVSLDTDRILRAMLALIKATLRTNFYITDSNGAARQYLSLKVEPREIAELPKPRPQFEIFVYSPRVEGVHLRFGPVARGGLRWSDRLEDFRTEVLGLVKAQAVKNAVIVPVGSKGGFVVKHPPAPTADPAADRQAFLDEGIACYRLFISGLLDLTDNIDTSSGAVLPPARVVRRDSDDTYLVVAADKGTATFSDIANDVARQYGFWLGDAFASGGSAGYDHKAMGITAKGAWESVKRHFSELGIDTQSQDFTVAGIGDMSGDVFGNGMLLSRHIRLVAAFDHRHIFIDPNPDAASSFTERERMFALPRSSWADYDSSLISAGGGVYDRTAKAIPVSEQARAALGLGPEITQLSPPEMVKAILLAPVDLLWNGGIGTYIKASTETNPDVGDKSNDAVRVNGGELRVKVIGEGGNLGATARGRIEFCVSGGKMNTDALDNSAGVDCSDHEVNIKILLDSVVSNGELPIAERNPLLASMTEEVAELVLRDNVSQNYLMGLSRAEASAMLSVQRRVISDLEARHGLDRELEALPSNAEIDRRAAAGLGLTSPELSTIMAHVKLGLKADLLASDLPDNPVFAARLPGYFPVPLRERFVKAIKAHPLRREIVTTVVANEVVDMGGITYAHRLAEEAGATSSDAVRVFTAAAEIFNLHDTWARIRKADMPADVKDELELETKRTLDRASRWLLTNRPQPLPIRSEINRYADGVRRLSPKVPAWLKGHHLTGLASRSDALIQRGAPADLATDVFRLLNLFPLLDIVDIADIIGRDGEEVGALYYTLNDHLKIEWLLNAVTSLERGDRWHALARLAVRDDMYASLRSLTVDVLTAGDPGESAEEKISYWESRNQSRLSRARTALSAIYESGDQSLATLSVAAKQVRSMISAAGAQTEGAH